MTVHDAISVFIRTVDWEKLKERWELPKDTRNPLFDKDFHDYWSKYPQLRPGQVLINLGKIPDQGNIWDDEYLTLLATCRKGKSFRV